MIAEPIKAKRNMEFICNLLHLTSTCTPSSTSPLKLHRESLVKSLRLTKLLSSEEIRAEIVYELSTIPNQLEYLIEDALPFDSYTFIEKIENGEVDVTVQILLLCIIHAMNMNILYESSLSEDIREYS
jgi:hypothetical protein